MAVWGYAAHPDAQSYTLREKDVRQVERAKAPATRVRRIVAMVARALARGLIEHHALIRDRMPRLGGIWADLGAGTGNFIWALVELIGTHIGGARHPGGRP